MATVDLGKIRFNWKGAYAAGTAYVANDVVSSGGSSYMCIQAVTGTAPPNATYWSVMSSAGTDGTDVGTTITTQGDLLYRDGSGLQRLAKGTAAQVLKMNAGATAPEWGADEGLPAAGADGQILTSDGTNWASEAAAGGGKVLQAKYINYTTQWSTITGTYDTRSGTPPTNSVGTEVITLAITPLSATSKLYYHLTLAIGGSPDNKHALIMLFRDTGTTCLNAIQEHLFSGGEWYPTTFAGVLDSTATTATTLKIRAGLDLGGGTLYINRGSNTTTFGGSCITSSFKIIEIEV
jgi:hypothetical protein